MVRGSPTQTKRLETITPPLPEKRTAVERKAKQSKAKLEKRTAVERKAKQSKAKLSNAKQS